MNKFKENYVYTLKQTPDASVVFVVLPVTKEMGKIVQYLKVDKSVYDRIGAQYMINYAEESFHDFMLNVDNYEPIGILNQHFYLSDDNNRLFVLRTVK